MGSGVPGVKQQKGIFFSPQDIAEISQHAIDANKVRLVIGWL